MNVWPCTGSCSIAVSLKAVRQSSQNFDLVQNVKQFVPEDQGKDMDRVIVI